MAFIYLITSPEGKVYVGQSTIPVERKLFQYSRCIKYDPSTRPIVNAIKKYGWGNMKFEILEESGQWTAQELDDRERYWIKEYDSYNNGYNLTIGGEGVDSESAKLLGLRTWANMPEEKRKIHAKSCSAAQLKRFQETPETALTKQRKSDAHKGHYLIESPDGRSWETKDGLKEFAEKFKDEIKLSYWQLFNVYRLCYTKQHERIYQRKPKSPTFGWRVNRIDNNTS